MKKTILLVIILLISFFVFKNFENEIIIPSDSLRFRVIANSNSKSDQLIKIKVRNNIEKILINKMKNIEDVKEAEIIINNSINEINESVNNTLIDNNYENDYKVNFGYNYFPEKKYNGIVYKKGNYKSLVVTLGKGNGNNWWCVLFPPLCLIDANETESDKIEYKFYIKKLIDKYFN